MCTHDAGSSDKATCWPDPSTSLSQTGPAIQVGAGKAAHLPQWYRTTSKYCVAWRRVFVPGSYQVPAAICGA